MTDLSFRAALLTALVALAVGPGRLSAQDQPAPPAPTIRWSALAYLDYYYNLDAPEEAARKLHGFTYRRVYLTGDYRLSERFSGRLRLEASDGTTDDDGLPMPFVKDLYLQWDFAEGHGLILGVSPTPALEVSESVWGYRSLEKTILDLFRIVSSRDFGVAARGPITANGSLRYWAMFGNGEGVRPEDDARKRGYAQVAWTGASGFNASAYGDVAGAAPDLRRWTGALFAGYASDALRAGVEGFLQRTSGAEPDPAPAGGVSLFGAVRLAPRWHLVGRFDRAWNVPGGDASFALGGVEFRPSSAVRLIPNLFLLRFDDDERPLLAPRVTLHLDVR